VAVVRRGLAAEEGVMVEVWSGRMERAVVWDLNSTTRSTIWAIFAGWCIGVLGASVARKIYR
jgi:hypothetical protein